MVGFGCDSDGEISIDMRDLLIKLPEAQRLNPLFIKPLIPAFGSSKSQVAIATAAERLAASPDSGFGCIIPLYVRDAVLGGV